MSNGTSLSFLVYMIYNKSIWKYKGEESGYMEKAMEKIKNKNKKGIFNCNLLVCQQLKSCKIR